MARIFEKLFSVVRALYASKEADRAVEESKSMADLVGKLLPVVIGLALAGSIAAGGAKWSKGGK